MQGRIQRLLWEGQISRNTNAISETTTNHKNNAFPPVLIPGTKRKQVFVTLSHCFWKKAPPCYKQLKHIPVPHVGWCKDALGRKHLVHNEARCKHTPIVREIDGLFLWTTDATEINQLRRLFFWYF